MEDKDFWENVSHPVDWRYGSRELRKIISPSNLVKIYAKIESVVAEAEAEVGIIPKEAAEDIKEAAKKVDFEAVVKFEKVTKHDITALIKAISENCRTGDCRRYIHYGLTSQDIKDTAFALLLKESLSIINTKICKVVKKLIELSEKFSGLPCVGRTHGVHANIYLLGHKFAVFADEFIRHLERLQEGEKRFLVGKISGAVGIHSVLGEKGIEVEKKVMEKLGLYRAEFSTQVVPRDRYAEFFLILSMISSSLDRLATEIRNLHRTEINEVNEGFTKGQTGSSAMPHKRNPIYAENVSSLSRILRGLVIPVLENIVLWHERDLTNSASERVLLADFLLLLDEQLTKTIKILDGLVVNVEQIEKNLWLTKGLIFSEHVMYKLIEKGLSRVKAHSLIIDISGKVIRGDYTFKEALLNDPEIGKILTDDEIKELFQIDKYIKVAQKLVKKLKQKYLESELINKNCLKHFAELKTLE